MLMVQYALTSINPFAAGPIWSDEYGYWRELFSFSNCGFAFGNSEGHVGYEAMFGPLGCHGLAPIVSWGLYARMFPWTSGAIVIANCILVTIAFALLLFIARPSWKQAIVLAAGTLLYPALILYSPTSMMESPCYAGIIVYMALLFRYENDRRSIWFFLLLLCGTWCALLRIRYIVLLFPAILLQARQRIDLKLLLKLVAYVAYALSLNKVMSLFLGGYPWGFFNPLSLEPSVAGKFLLLWNNLNPIHAISLGLPLAPYQKFHSGIFTCSCYFF